MRARAPAKTLRAQRTYWTPPRMMTAPVDQAKRLGLAAELVVDCECAAEGLEAPRRRRPALR